MKEIKLFECEFCKKQYPNEDLCIECEEYHMLPQEIVKFKYDKYALVKYPNTITVLMSDGQEIVYNKNERVIN